MKVIDTDLLSVQEARILLEEAYHSRENLLEVDKKTRAYLLGKIKKYYEENLEKLTKLAFDETNYGKSEDELRLAKFYLDNLDEELRDYPQIFDVVEGGHNKEVALAKGVSLIFIAPYLSTLTSFQAIYLATRAANPVIIVSDSRCKQTVTKMVKDIIKIEDELYYPKGSLSILEYGSKLGERTLYESDKVSFIVENILSDNKREIKNENAQVFEAEVGNNIVFIDKSCDVDKASYEVINSKAFNNGLLPGVEQSIVVEENVYEKTVESFKKHGAYFLSKDEHVELEKIIYDKDHKVRKELIGRTVKEIADIAGIKVDDDTKILVVTKPYVSETSPYSKEKYNPIVSLYIENDWLNACEKCVELILNDKKGQSLSIYSNDSYVIEQFIEKKPVSRVLVNSPTGLGSVGIGTNLPISFSLSTKKIDGSNQTSLSPNHFMKFREIGICDRDDINSFLNKKEIEKDKNLFSKVLNSLNKDY
ncbi:aldehyde dehydrogenase family protein [Anaerococcus sp. AGMB00486]|uniref:Aldehyde dehydrogenase family protein n=1 Tax=Anaerococcus faecalis TaxID=2742993 RepID=A0ABX2N9Y0_9FIRM|nr:aldehyde dehydrogenase family protein [Anaerococcus faecalis]NVF11509.1 aldehyde dehydrogenase family protein [Anaerococcus faecalis]